MAKKTTFLYNGKKLVITAVVIKTIDDQDNENTEVLAPGRGVVEITTPVLSNEAITSGIPVSCKITVRGKNIAQISSELMLQIQKSLIGPLLTNMLPSPEDREIRGMRYPRWTSENEIEFEMIPTIKLLYSGEEDFTLACMRAEKYGVAPEEQLWSLEGVYQRGGGEPFRAKLEFNGQGLLVRKMGFSPASQKGLVVSPFELFIEDGDTFEPYVTVLSNSGKENLATVNPIILSRANLLHWVQVQAPKGTYQLGVIIDDFDGHRNRKYSRFAVE